MKALALKGQSEIIAVVLIMLIAIGLLSVAFTFGLPLVQKNQDRSLDQRVQSFFDPGNVNSLPSKIKSVANNGGKESISLDVEGLIELDEAENSIAFSFQSSVASHAVEQTVALSGDTCPPAEGIIGLQEPSVLCVSTYLTSGGFYNVTYKLYLRELEDAEKKNGFKINMLKHPAGLNSVGGSGSSVRIEFEQRRPEILGQKNLINTDVKILLV